MKDWLQSLSFRQYFNFGVVGVIGFIIDGGGMMALTAMGIHPIVARVPSFILALLTTWALNRQLTFRGDAPAPLLNSLMLYIAGAGVGAGINWLIYSALVLQSAFMFEYPIIALAIATGFSMVFNFNFFKRIAFKQKV